MNNLLNPSQHGFREGRSCLSQLLAHVDNLINCISEEGNADVLYLDFQKAFDKCDHEVIKTRMKEVKMKGKIALWVSDFLEERTQRIKIGKTRRMPALGPMTLNANANA